MWSAFIGPDSQSTVALSATPVGSWQLQLVVGSSQLGVGSW